MTGVNKIILVGHLGGDPEVRRTQDGRPVASFSVATSESWRDKTTGERKQHTDWHRVVIFHEALCDVAEKYLKKGSKVYIEAASKTRKWTDKAGVDRWVTECVLHGFNAKLVMLDRAERAPEPSSGDYGTGDTRDDSGASAPSRPAGRAELDDEIPF